ncbi:hypothetical protein [Peijinzhouia sedimentorum]
MIAAVKRIEFEDRGQAYSDFLIDEDDVIVEVLTFMGNAYEFVGHRVVNKIIKAGTYIALEDAEGITTKLVDAKVVNVIDLTDPEECLP